MILLAVWLAVQAPDSVTRVHWENTLRATSDSLDQVRGAIATFRADLEPASSALVLQRAERVNTGCMGAHRALQSLQALLGTPYTSKSAHEQADLRSSTGHLLATMEQCGKEWTSAPGTAARADSLRVWGPYRTSRLENQMQDFIGVMKRFMKAAALTKPA